MGPRQEAEQSNSYGKLSARRIGICSAAPRRASDDDQSRSERQGGRRLGNRVSGLAAAVIVPLVVAAVMVIVTIPVLPMPVAVRALIGAVVVPRGPIGSRAVTEPGRVDAPVVQSPVAQSLEVDMPAMSTLVPSPGRGAAGSQEEHYEARCYGRTEKEHSALSKSSALSQGAHHSHHAHRRLTILSVSSHCPSVTSRSHVGAVETARELHRMHFEADLAMRVFYPMN